MLDTIRHRIIINSVSAPAFLPLAFPPIAVAQYPPPQTTVRQLLEESDAKRLFEPAMEIRVRDRWRYAPRDQK